MQSGCQIYVKNSIEAVAFYQKAFNANLGMNILDANGVYEHASLMFGEREILAVAEDKNDTNSPLVQNGKLPVMSFNCYDLGSREAVDQAYKVLSEDARSTENPGGPAPLPWNEYCFYLVDKFGVYWWVAI